MRVLGVITARGGSKGIPRKNLCLLAGKPLLQYTAEAALASARMSEIILSTEDAEIAEMGRQFGLHVPFLRPVHLARDDTLSIPVVQHAVRWMMRQGESFDAVCTLQPTSPLRRSEDIDGAIALLQKTGADSVISYVDVGEKHPARMKLIAADGRVMDHPYAERMEGQRRQDLTKLYLREGSIYLTLTSVLLEQNSLKGQHCQAWLIPEERACTIDTPFDLLLTEQIIKSMMAAETSPGIRVEEPINT